MGERTGAWVKGLVGLVTVLLLPALLSAADYPNTPINLIVPYAAGGSTDVAARALAKVSPKRMPQPLVVVNQPGGAGITGRVAVVKAAPDGYALLFGYDSGEDLVTPHTRKIPYDQKGAGLNGTTIPFRGGAEAVTALLGGNTDFSGQVYSEAMPHVKAGRLKVLAVGTRERDPVIPDIPTFIEEGVNVWTFGAIRGIGAPKDTPEPVIGYLEGAVKKITEDPEFHQVMKDLVHPVLFRDRKAFLKNMQDGFDMYGKLIKELNLKLE